MKRTVNKSPWSFFTLSIVSLLAGLQPMAGGVRAAERKPAGPAGHGQGAGLAPGPAGPGVRPRLHAAAADALGLEHVVRRGQGTGRPLGLCRGVWRLREREGRRRGAGQSPGPQRPVPGPGRRQSPEVQAGRPGRPPVPQGHAAGSISTRRPGQLHRRQVAPEEPEPGDAGRLPEAGRHNSAPRVWPSSMPAARSPSSRTAASTG